MFALMAWAAERNKVGPLVCAEVGCVNDVVDMQLNSCGTAADTCELVQDPNSLCDFRPVAGVAPSMRSIKV
jgi:hypothetical protein